MRVSLAEMVMAIDSPVETFASQHLLNDDPWTTGVSGGKLDEVIAPKLAWIVAALDCLSRVRGCGIFDRGYFRVRSNL